MTTCDDLTGVLGQGGSPGEVILSYWPNGVGNGIPWQECTYARHRVKLSPLPQGPRVVLETTDSLNVREGPGTSYKVRYVLPKGAQIEVYDVPGASWVQIASQSLIGWWVYRAYLQVPPPPGGINRMGIHLSPGP